MSNYLKKPTICRSWTTNRPWKGALNRALHWFTEFKRSFVIIVGRDWARETYGWFRELNDEAKRRDWQLKFNPYNGGCTVYGDINAPGDDSLCGWFLDKHCQIIDNKRKPPPNCVTYIGGEGKNNERDLVLDHIEYCRTRVARWASKTRLSFDLLEDAALETLVRCARAWKPDGEAAFKTYLSAALENRLGDEAKAWNKLGYAIGGSTHGLNHGEGGLSLARPEDGPSDILGGFSVLKVREVAAEPKPPKERAATQRELRKYGLDTELRARGIGRDQIRGLSLSAIRDLILATKPKRS